MFKSLSVLVTALVGISVALPLAQEDGFRGDEAPNVLIHSGYANIRRQGRMHGSASFAPGRSFYKKGRTLDIESIKIASDEPEPAPVYKGPLENALTKGLVGEKPIDEASKLAIEKMEKDILNAITSTSAPEAVPVTEKEVEEEKPTSTEEAPVTTTEQVMESTSSSSGSSTEAIEIEEIIATTTAKPQTPEENETTQAPQEETIILEKETTSAPPSTESSKVESSTDAEEEIQESIELTTLQNLIAREEEILEEETSSLPSEIPSLPPVTTEAIISTTKQQPPEEIDLGSVEEVIS
eukprot:TRINITY_DN992_c0_g1_i1.p1 TRINITY_DN992_c0_g1~~TRINITY_DN992_c0_g1_i1.p1  ORF type:complete len:297 (+),score=97.25 TRINITY_DN992_c0_g1_i1:185-1075(+)